jgi:hypothetical protein
MKKQQPEIAIIRRGEKNALHPVRVNRLLNLTIPASLKTLKCFPRILPGRKKHPATDLPVFIQLLYLFSCFEQPGSICCPVTGFRTEGSFKRIFDHNSGTHRRKTGSSNRG